jgi:hypothetical protein
MAGFIPIMSKLTMESIPGRLMTPIQHPAHLPAMARPVAPARQVRIRNKQCGVYLYEASNQVRYYSPDNASLGAVAYWRMEDFHGSKRFTNKVTGNTISIEHQYPCVESIPVKDCWLSACWTLEPVAEGYIIRSVWHNWHILHIDVLDGYAQYGGALLNPAGAVWVLED